MRGEWGEGGGGGGAAAAGTEQQDPQRPLTPPPFPPPHPTPCSVVSRQQVAAAQRRQELAHEDPGTQGVSEGELRASLASMVQAGGDRAPFHQVFQPQEVANLLLEARGDDVCIIDVRHRCPFTDYMVLATARSQRLVHMLAAAVLHELKGRCREVAPGVAPGVEGLQVREGGGAAPAAARCCRRLLRRRQDEHAGCCHC